MKKYIVGILLFILGFTSAITLITVSKESYSLDKLSDSSSAIFKVKEKDRMLTLEVARSEEKKAEGLMFRTSLQKDHGMLFIFNKIGPLVFWMKNTSVSLDILFLDSNFKIVKIYQNTKTDQTEEIYPSNYDSQYAVETNAGWVKANDIKPLDIFELVKE